jgi:hypothetical protein
MALQKRKAVSKGRRWNYFYLNGNLHKTLETHRSEDLIVAWDFSQNKRVAYVLNDAYRRRQRAFTSNQVSKMLNRHVDTLKRHIRAEEIRKPQAVYSLDGTNKLIQYMFNEDDVREIYDFFKTVHRGRPRKDGRTTISDLPSKAELEALLRNETVLYAKSEEGEFVPVWKQPEW